MSTSFDTLMRHREKHADRDESCKVWLYHSHVYFDHGAPEQVAAAREFRELIRRTFAATDHVEVHSFFPVPAGPHRRGSFEVLFTREAFADYVSWLMLMRPVHFDILVHPLTRSQTLDHSVRAFWLGTPQALDHAMLAAVDARLQASGKSEEAIIEATRRH